MTGFGFGCGSYRVAIVETGSGSVVWSGAGQTLIGSFNRGEGVISTAGLSVDLSRCGVECVNPVGVVTHELGFWRDDRPSEPAWIGPVMTSEVVDNQWQITAVDRMWWFEGAAAVRDFVAIGAGQVDAVTAFETLLDLGREYRDAGLNVWFEGRRPQSPPLSGIPVEVRLLAGDPLWPEISLLSRSSVDWSVVGPHLYWGSPRVPVVDGPVLTTDAWVVAPRALVDGSRWCSQVRVSGAGDIVAFWPEVDTVRRRMVPVSDPDIETQGQALARAQEVFSYLSSPSLLVSTGSTSLSDRFPHDLAGLIPGRRYLADVVDPCVGVDGVLVELFQLEVTVQTGVDGRHLETDVAADFRQPADVTDVA